MSVYDPGSVEAEIDAEGLPVEGKDVNDDEASAKSGDQMEELETNGDSVGMFGTVMNMLNSVLGAGILGVPSSFHEAGIIVSIIILLLIAFLAHLGTVMLVYLQHDLNAKGLDDLTNILLGKFWTSILSILTVIFSYACMVGYLIIGGEQIQSWFELAGSSVSSSWRPWMMLIYSLLIPVALTIPRSIKFL